LSVSILERLSGIIADRLGVAQESVTLEANFKDDLNADSLDVVELVMEVEDEFDISIPDEDVEKLVTLKALVDYITAATESSNQ
jgi:acyl carrier protein